MELGTHKMAESIRILLIDDQQLMHRGLCILLELEPDLKGAGARTGMVRWPYAPESWV